MPSKLVTTSRLDARFLTLVLGSVIPLRQLLEEYSDTNVINYQDNNGQAPLHWACKKQYTSCVREILSFYPDIYLKDNEGCDALTLARSNINAEVKTLLQNYGIIQPLVIPILPLIAENACKMLEAVQNGAESELRRLIDLVDMGFTLADKNTVLHICAAHGYPDCLKIVLSKVGISFPYQKTEDVQANHLSTSVNADKKQPIEVAAEGGHVECVQELVEVIKDDRAMVEKVWDLAIDNKHKRLLQWLHTELGTEIPEGFFPPGNGKNTFCT